MTGPSVNIHHNYAIPQWQGTAAAAQPMMPTFTDCGFSNVLGDADVFSSNLPGFPSSCGMPGNSPAFMEQLMPMFGGGLGVGFPPFGPCGQMPPQITDCFPMNGNDNFGVQVPQNPCGVPVRLIEVGENKGLDQHGAQVAEIYTKALNNDAANVDISILDQDETMAPGEVPYPEQFQSKADLDQYIDYKGSYVLAQMAKEINATETGVVNASLGWTRISTYMDVITLLQEQPQLAQYVGLTPADLQGVDLSNPEKPVIPPKVEKQIVSYVDERFGAGNSAYKQALGIYQDAAARAAEERNVNIIVAVANDGEYRKFFPSAKVGADTNFLALSHDVISVAAADMHGTQDLRDDTIPEFSSHGNYVFTPTIAAKGVDVKTSSGPVEGTSFATPIVSALMTRMLQINPDLTPAEIRQILQETAYDTKAPDIAEGAGMLNAYEALELAEQTNCEAA